MKRIYSIIIIAAFCSLVSGQQIAEIIEYTPAPGQFINTAVGNPEAAESLTRENGGLVSLGGFGGYIIFRLASPIENDPDNPYGVDFTLFGNAIPNWAEPGIVAVMKDENQNGIADETWYELAGSDHFFPGTVYNYLISYTNPLSDVAEDIPWNDNLGTTGYLKITNFQNQPYYPDPEVFPAIGESNCEFSGTRIYPVLDFSNPAMNISSARLFGYADNNIRIEPDNPLPDNPYSPGSENSGGDGMDIAWATDESGHYVDLDEISFIKIYTGVNSNGSYLGEISTEITRIVDIEARTGYPIPEKIISVLGLPLMIAPEAYELEYSVFFNGRYVEDETVSWTTNADYNRIDGNYVLLAEFDETFTLTATLDSDPTIQTSFTTQVDQSLEASPVLLKDMSIYPNPCTDFLIIELEQQGDIELLSAQGQVVCTEKISGKSFRLDMSPYLSGVYFLRYYGDIFNYNKVLIKR